jgi:uncharacterized membrane protein
MQLFHNVLYTALHASRSFLLNLKVYLENSLRNVCATKLVLSVLAEMVCILCSLQTMYEGNYIFLASFVVYFATLLVATLYDVEL